MNFLAPTWLSHMLTSRTRRGAPSNTNDIFTSSVHQLRNLKPRTGIIIRNVVILAVLILLTLLVSRYVRRAVPGLPDDLSRAQDADTGNVLEHDDADSVSNEGARVSLIIPFLADFLFYAWLLAVFIISLLLFGVNPVHVVAVIGSIGLALAIGMQGLLSDLAAGILIAVEGNYQINDIIEVDGIMGRVKHATLFRTTLVDIPTNKQTMVPNSTMHSRSFKNVSALKYVAANFNATVRNVQYTGDQTARIIDIIRDAVLKTPGIGVLPSSVVVNVGDITAFGTSYSVYAHYSSDKFPVGEGMLKTAVHRALEKNGIENDTSEVFESPLVPPGHSMTNAKKATCRSAH